MQCPLLSRFLLRFILVPLVVTILVFLFCAADAQADPTFADIQRAKVIVVGRLRAERTTGTSYVSPATLVIERVVKGTLPSGVDKTRQLTVAVVDCKMKPTGEIELWEGNGIDGGSMRVFSDAREPLIWQLLDYRASTLSDDDKKLPVTYLAGGSCGLVYEDFCKLWSGDNPEASVKKFLAHPTENPILMLQYRAGSLLENCSNNTGIVLSTDDPIHWMTFQCRQYLEHLRVERVMKDPPAKRVATLWSIFESTELYEPNIIAKNDDIEAAIVDCGIAAGPYLLSVLKRSIDPYDDKYIDALNVAFPDPTFSAGVKAPPDPAFVESLRKNWTKLREQDSILRDDPVSRKWELQARQRTLHQSITEILGKIKYKPAVPELTDWLQRSVQFYKTHQLYASPAKSFFEPSYRTLDDERATRALEEIGDVAAKPAIMCYRAYWKQRQPNPLNDRDRQIEDCERVLKTLSSPKTSSSSH